MRNLSPLFSNNEDGYIGNIELTQYQKKMVQAAKIKIRDYLRAGITEIIKSQHNVKISPRFLSQGSYVYKTRNKPCKNPPQQIDHDLGCYLPLSYVEENNSPSMAADIFFAIVDNLLVEIVEREKWQSVVTNKETCSRVIVNNEIHIDIPLYSIPDYEFHLITESADRGTDLSVHVAMDALSQQDWEMIKDNVLLAHRTDNWIVSDPRKLNNYFKYVFDVKGEQLRRICRYLKAWRDYKWEKGGPSSIYLMIVADSIFKSKIDRRDDLALLNILRKLPTQINKPVVNPADEVEQIRISDQDREKLQLFAEEFSVDLAEAIYTETDSGKACNLIRDHLGSRFPYNNTLNFNKETIRKKVQSTPITEDNEYREPEDRGRAG